METSTIGAPREELVELVCSVTDVLPDPSSGGARDRRRARMTARGRVILAMLALIVVVGIATGFASLGRHPVKPAIAGVATPKAEHPANSGPPPTILFPLQRPSD